MAEMTARCGSARTSAAGIPIPSRAGRRAAAALAARGDRRHASGPAPSTLGADGGTVAFIHDRDTSDVWLLDLDGGAPERLTTGRDPAPYWEDTAPRLSPDGRPSPTPTRARSGSSPAAGGPPRSCRGPRARCGSTTTGSCVAVERERRDAGWSSSTSTTRGRAARSRRRRSRRRGGAGRLAGRRRGRLRRSPPRRPERHEIRVTDVATGDDAGAHRHARHARRRARPGRPTARRRLRLRARRGGTRSTSSAPTASGDRQLTDDDADFSELALAPRRRRALVGSPRPAGPLRPRHRRRRDRRRRRRSRRAALGRRRAGLRRRRRRRRRYEDHATPPRAAPRRRRRRARSRPRPGPGRASARPRTSSPEDVTYRSIDGLEIPAGCSARRQRRAEQPVPAVVYPHGGPTDALRRRVGRPRPVLHRQGLRLAPDQLPRLHAVRPRLRARQPRRLGRRRHEGLPGRRRLPARRSAGSTATGSAIFGRATARTWRSSRSSTTPSTASAAPSASTATATSSPRGRRATASGVQDLERMMGHPSRHRGGLPGRLADPPARAASPCRSSSPTASRTSASARSSRRSSSTALRRLGKTFEYVTYPTEGHGFLRAGPQIDFYRPARALPRLVPA